jgi:tryptophan-rich sensory protein
MGATPSVWSPQAKQLPTWVPIMLMVLVPLACIGLGFASGTGAKFTNVQQTTPSAPPGPVFAVVWTVLYALVGSAMVQQGLAALTPAHWASLGLLTASVIASWGWPTIWSQAQRGSVSANAPVWMIWALLVVGGTGLALVPTATAGALWVPYVLWLICALGLALQQRTIQTIRLSPSGK